MTALAHIANAFRMTDEAWTRHANPWSVYTRFAAIPAMILAIWSRAWIGWWALVPVGAVVLWLWLNPHVFPAVTTPRAWAARGIYGERLWLHHRATLPVAQRRAFWWIGGIGVAGFVLLAWGLVRLDAWPTWFGATLIVIGQLWRIDRLARLYDDHGGSDRASGG